MRQMLLDENLDVIQVIPVLAEDYEIEDLGIAKAYGLDVLIKVMGEALPDARSQNHRYPRLFPRYPFGSSLLHT